MRLPWPHERPFAIAGREGNVMADKESGVLFGSEKQRFRKPPKRGKKRSRVSEGAEDEEAGNLSAKILAAAAEQRDEVAHEERKKAIPPEGPSSAKAASSDDDDGSGHDQGDDDDDDGDEEEEQLGDGERGGDEASEMKSRLSEQDFDPAEGVTEEDERALAAFASSEGQRQTTLAEAVMSKVRGKMQGEQEEEEGGNLQEQAAGMMEPEVADVYRRVGDVMRKYKSGRVPKALKVIPSLSNWEEALFLTDPEGWTPHATYQATRIFASNLNAKMAQRFLSLVLLPRFRADVARDKRVHFTMFQALKKALYKPGAFYKGLLLPLCQAGDCTLQEAVILSSVIQRKSIPVAHSSAALLKIAQMPYSGTNSFFIKTLVEKKYALPHRVIDALVDHFASFSDDERRLPVVWHQSLLSFVQRYRHEMRADDKERLRSLCKHQRHYLISPEVLRELSQEDGNRESRRPSFISSKLAAHKENLSESPHVRLFSNY